ncbi:MAG: HAMP domain-containing protein [Eggerthellaceae bacterium]|nr:HAMP domain-containing protein [Eggerthellaceae bacterium]
MMKRKKSDNSASSQHGKMKSWWGNLSYTTRMTCSFALIALMTALVAAGFLAFVWEQHFQTYTRENMQITADSTAARIAERYVEEGGWTTETVSAAAYVGVTYPGVGIVVADSSGTTRYDSTNVVNPEQGSSARSLAPPDPDSVATADIMVNGESVGLVRVWVYGSDGLLRQTDLAFRENSYQAMAIASVLAIVLASGIGFLFARSLVRPIKRMTQTAKAIGSGDLTARTGLQGDDEISQLGETFDAMAESVEKDRKLERRLTTDVAHELRTPLMAIRSTVEAMIDGVFVPDEERLATVNSEVERLSRLVDALLKLSRLENRSTPMKNELVNVGDLVSSIIGAHEAFVVDSGLEMVYEAESDVLVRGDADMIRQATANLISNAVRYTPEGGMITVKVYKGEIMASIMVQDTGIGLTPEEAKMVFSRFWRAEAGRNRESGGLGIGLSVVKEIVDRHGGWVEVQGKKDEGARFIIHLPLYSKERELAQQREAARQQRRLGKRANR